MINEKKLIKAVCVFCSSSNSVSEIYHQTATDLGHQIGNSGLDLIYGGASIGLMGAVARGVHDKGGRVIGVIPEFFRKKNKSIEYTDADELIVVKDMRSRKAIMDQRSDAFIVLPGGVGTLEEAMEIISMKQLCLTEKPLAFINTKNFYSDLIFSLQKMVDLKFAKPSTLSLFTICPNPVSAVDFILTNYSKKTVK